MSLINGNGQKIQDYAMATFALIQTRAAALWSGVAGLVSFSTG
jgi:hypothetical protein